MLMNLLHLETTLKQLRDQWPHAWPGMEVVVRDALQRLGFTAGATLSERDQALYDCIFSVIATIEVDGERRAAQQLEPQYHNRLHFADAVVSLTALLVNERQIAGRAADALPSHAEWLGMLTVVSHDLLHNGKINQFRSEIEAMSVKALTLHMVEHGVHPDDQALIATMILKTDPAFVPESHQLIANLPFDLSDPRCLLVLIQECDILASALPGTGHSLTQQLSDEWAPLAPDLSRSLLTDKGRLYFLKHMALFSSPSSRLLGIQAKIDQQIAELEQA
jgi:hypothetical protein